MPSPDNQAPILSSPIRGGTLFRGGTARLCDMLVGDPVGLIREPDNPVDSHAVICTNDSGDPIGYIAREVAVELAAWMDKGWAYYGRIIQSGKIRRNSDGSRSLLRNSVFVRCFPIQPISLSATSKQTSKVPSQVEDEFDSLKLF